MAPLRAAGIIPARWSSTRFPGKVLAPLAGRPLVEHVWRRAKGCPSLNRVAVATDDERVAAVVRGFGGEAFMTPAGLPSGTDRVARVAAELPDEIVVNIQGDEPLVRPEMIEALIEALRGDEGAGIATLATHLRSAAELLNPNVVKVVADRCGRARYFSRFPIPFSRDTTADLGWGPGRGLKHVGIYAYRREVLLRLAGLPPSPVEIAEGLEQLRFLDHGLPIRVVYTAHESSGVDTPEDLEKIRPLFEGAEAGAPP